MTRLTKTIIQSGIHYFIVMAGFHIAMLFLSVFGQVIILLLAERCILTSSAPVFHHPSDHNYGVRFLLFQTNQWLTFNLCLPA